ncbi:MAG: chemotaxis protein CheA [Defluviitaleaceae bacterium]|nr:chemotaxis protein CheA [Defluviitaleaceae bacterium]
MDDLDRDAMLETFIHEMGILVDQLENVMLITNEMYDGNTINEIFRIMHTIKGSSSMMLFTSLTEITHATEDLFFFLRENNPENIDYPLITDIVLEVVDFIKIQLASLEEAKDLDMPYDELMEKIQNCLLDLKKENKINLEIDDNLKIENNSEIKNTKKINVSEIPRYRAIIYFQEGSEMENVRAFTVIHNLGTIATDISTIPENVLDEDSIWKIRTDGFKIEFNSDHDIEQVRNILLQSIYIKDLNLEQIFSYEEEYNNVFDVFVKFQEGCEMENIRAFTFISNLPKYVTVLSQEPENLLDENNARFIAENGFSVVLSTNISKEQLKEILMGTIYLDYLQINEKENNIYEDILNTYTEEDEIENKEEKSKSEDTSQKKDINLSLETEKIKKTTSHSINVNVTKLDQLLNLVGELVISEAMVTQNPELEGMELESFTKESRQLRKIIGEIQYTVMSMRMVPLGPTFFKMNRIVRDMCRQLKKDVNLKIIGDETEVDKNIIEHIADPLMHIIRNSIDHGIESPEERLSKNKPEQGTIILEAKNSGGDVLIIIKDDGAGFNKDKILKKAIANNLLSKPEDEYTEKEIFQFIFYPGFSTNETITSFSGRGVGMDVVNTNLEYVGGTVIADSIDGKGSSITLKIPLTLAIIDGMLIKIGDAKYTVPIMDIRRSLKISKKDIVFDPNGNEMVKIRGEVYNLIRLNTFFGLDIGYTDIEDGIVLMLENESQTVCLFADELVGEQQIVVKNIPKYIKKVHGLSGCTLLGNGDISLIINVAAFFDK